MSPLSSPPRRRIRRWFVWLTVLAVLVLILYVARAPLLRGLARSLMVESHQPGVSYLVLVGGDRTVTEAVELSREEGVKGVLLLDTAPSRLVRLGILEPRVQSYRRELEERGLDRERIQILSAGAKDPWSLARFLREWLGDHEGVRVTLLCHCFDSRRMQYILNQELGSEAESRIFIRAVPAAEYDEYNWWECKRGRMDIAESLLKLVHARAGRESENPWREWDYEAYERELKHLRPVAASK